MRAVMLVLACAATCLSQQLDDNTVTVTVNRTVMPQPDQAVLTFTLTGPITFGLSDVLAAVPAAGITSENLVSVRSFTDSSGSSKLSWQFSKAIAFSDLTSALPTFGGFKIAPVQAGNVSPFSLMWFLQSQTSQAALQAAAVCPIPTLLADAQAQAQQIANAAGVRIGGVVSMAQGAALPVPTAVFRSGEFTQGVIYDPSTGTLPSYSYVSFLLAQPISPAGCSLTVQFKLLR